MGSKRPKWLEEAADDIEYVEACHQRVLDTMQLALDRLAQEQAEKRRARVRTGLRRVSHLLSR